MAWPQMPIPAPIRPHYELKNSCDAITADSRITASCVAREYREVELLLDDAERYLHGQEFECTHVERQVVTLDE